MMSKGGGKVGFKNVNAKTRLAFLSKNKLLPSTYGDLSDVFEDDRKRAMNVLLNTVLNLKTTLDREIENICYKFSQQSLHDGWEDDVIRSIDLAFNPSIDSIKKRIEESNAQNKMYEVGIQSIREKMKSGSDELDSINQKLDQLGEITMSNEVKFQEERDELIEMRERLNLQEEMNREKEAKIQELINLVNAAKENVNKSKEEAAAYREKAEKTKSGMAANEEQLHQLEAKIAENDEKLKHINQLEMEIQQKNMEVQSLINQNNESRVDIERLQFNIALYENSRKHQNETSDKATSLNSQTNVDNSDKESPNKSTIETDSIQRKRVIAKSYFAKPQDLRKSIFKRAIKDNIPEVTSDKCSKETTESKRVLRSTVKKSNIDNELSKKDKTQELVVKNKKRGIKRTRDKFELNDSNEYDYDMNTCDNKDLQVSTLSPACFADINAAVVNEAFDNEMIESVSLFENDKVEKQNLHEDATTNDFETSEESCSLLSHSDQSVDSQDFIRKSSRIKQKSTKPKKDSYVSPKTPKSFTKKGLPKNASPNVIESINLLADMTEEDTQYQKVEDENQKGLKSVKSSMFFVNHDCPGLSPSKRIKASSACIATSLTSWPSLGSLDTLEECSPINPGSNISPLFTPPGSNGSQQSFGQQISNMISAQRLCGEENDNSLFENDDEFNLNGDDLCNAETLILNENTQTVEDKISGDDLMETEEIETFNPTTSDEPSKKNIALKQSESIRYYFNSEDEGSNFSDNSMKDYIKPNNTNATKRNSIKVTKKNALPKKSTKAVKTTFSSCDENESDSSDDSSDDTVDYGKKRLNVKSEEILASRLAGLQCNSYSNLHAVRQTPVKVTYPARSIQVTTLNKRNGNDTCAKSDISMRKADKKADNDQITSAKSKKAADKIDVTYPKEASKKIKTPKTNKTKATSAKKKGRVYEAKKVATKPIVKTKNTKVAKETKSNYINTKEKKPNDQIETMKENIKPVCVQNIMKGISQFSTTNAVDSQANTAQTKRVGGSKKDTFKMNAITASNSVNIRQAATTENKKAFKTKRYVTTAVSVRDNIDEIMQMDKTNSSVGRHVDTNKATIAVDNKVNDLNNIKPAVEKSQANGASRIKVTDFDYSYDMLDEPAMPTLMSRDEVIKNFNFSSSSDSEEESIVCFDNKYKAKKPLATYSRFRR